MHTVTIDSIDNKKLLEEIYQTSNNIHIDLMGSFGGSTNHTYFEDSTFPWGKPESVKLLAEIEKVVSFVSGKDMKVSEAWTLTLGYGQSVMAHSHRSNNHMNPDEYYSVAYYVNAPEDSAKLVFEVGHSNISECISVFDTTPGMLIVFKSYLKHMTTRHMSNEARVVVSANLCPASPSTEVIPDLSGYKVV